jgi:hypothetical protein
MTPAELEAKMKQILEDHKGLILEADFETIKEKQPKPESENIEQIEQK